MDAREKEFVQIYNANFTKFYKHARYILKDDALASDCVQEMFVDIWNNLIRFTKAEHPNAYMFKALHHKALMLGTQARSRRKYENLAAIDASINGPSLIENSYKAMMGKVERALQHVQLGARAKEIYKLSKVEGVPVLEIRKRLNIGFSSVYNSTNLVHEKVMEWAEKHKEFMQQL